MSIGFSAQNFLFSCCRTGTLNGNTTTEHPGHQLLLFAIGFALFPWICSIIISCVGVVLVLGVRTSGVPAP